MDDAKCTYEELCRELNMDHDTEEKAWKRFSEVAQRFNLEGIQRHWFACALYASCRESWTPIVGSSEAVVIGNCVSLTKLLRCCNISIYEFVSKIKMWHEMANLPDQFRNQIDRLERNLSITFCLFQHYKNIFREIFAYSSIDKKNTKFRSVSKCTFGKLYDACWCLFLCVKNERQDTMDRATSLHLLICVIDLIYLNVLAENRTDLINQSFLAQSKKQFSADNIEDSSVIENLCQMTKISTEDVKSDKENTFKTIIKGLFDSKIIYGDITTCLGIISNQNFDRNFKSLNCSYEQYILNMGSFDERLLLNIKKSCQSYSPESAEFRHGDAIQEFTISPDVAHATRRGINFEAETSEKVKKLLEIPHSNHPPESLMNAGNAVLKKIADKQDTMTKRLLSRITNTTESETCLKTITSLCYALLERIIHFELRNKPDIDVKILLETESFYTALIICCAEIVLDSYNSELKFPWILSCFNIDAFNFFKIIEPVVKCNDCLLNRMHVKHLKLIEESCLESLSWQSSSPIWNIIGQTNLPPWAEVQGNTVQKRLNNTLHTNSPINSAFETFSGVNAADTARKDLFNTAKETTTEACRGPKNERSASSKIFFRKFYKLAFQRIEEFCKELNMENDLIKIWTLFEYSIMQCSELMKDRHLDQIIMCAIYIYTKVTEHQSNIMFTDIMKAYRKQPQAVSNTYREVLIETKLTNENEKRPVYKDIIHFYNNLYVKKMTNYALGFSKKKTEDNNLLLSPHPTERHGAPKKISSTQKIFVSPMEKSNIRHSPESLIYGIGSSPAKDLQKMNDVVKKGKRNLPFNEDSAICNKEQRLTLSCDSTIQGMINDRQSDIG